MAEAGKEKDPWDKLAALTPLILGLAVTGLGSYFTNVYNYRQLQLNQIEALDKLRPLLTSTRPEDREFGYASFAALGYEQIAIRIIGLNKDQSGRPLLVSLKASGSPAVQSSAASALKTLDAEQKLVNLGEFGAAVPDAAMTRDHPEIAQEAAGSPAHRAWAAEEAQTLGMTSKLGEAVLYDTAVQWGKFSAQRFADDSSKLTPPPLDTHEKQAAWLNAYLDERDRAAQQHLPQLYPALQRRTDRLRQLVASGDWELRTIDAAQADPAAPGATSGITPGATPGAPH